MSIDSADIERVARLARIDLEGVDVERLTQEMNDVLGHIDALRGLELEEGEGAPMGALRPSSTRDTTGEAPDELSIRPDRMAPDWRFGFFLVPPPPGVHHDGGA